MNIKEKIGDFALDIAKLIFGGVIISSIVNESINRWVIYSLGAFFSFVLMLIGFTMIDNSGNKKKEV